VAASAVLLAGCSGGSAPTVSASGTSPAASAPASSSPAAGGTGSASATAGPGSAPSASGTGTSGSSGSSGGGTGLAAQDAADVVDDVRAAFASARSVHIKGSLSQASETIALDVRLAGTKGTGTLTVGGLPVKITKIGDAAYINGNKAFWTRTAGGSAAAQLAGKWVKLPSSTPGFAQFLQFLQIKNGWDRLLTPTSTAGVTKGALVDVGGVRALELEDGKDGSLFVAAEGKPYPLRLTGAGGQKGRLDFTDYDEDVSISAPSGRDVITVPGS
jgi:hypothetical protein